MGTREVIPALKVTSLVADNHPERGRKDIPPMKKNTIKLIVAGLTGAAAMTFAVGVLPSDSPSSNVQLVAGADPEGEPIPETTTTTEPIVEETTTTTTAPVTTTTQAPTTTTTAPVVTTTTVPPTTTTTQPAPTTTTTTTPPVVFDECGMDVSTYDANARGDVYHTAWVSDGNRLQVAWQNKSGHLLHVPTITVEVRERIQPQTGQERVGNVLFTLDLAPTQTDICNGKIARWDVTDSRLGNNYASVVAENGTLVTPNWPVPMA